MNIDGNGVNPTMISFDLVHTSIDGKCAPRRKNRDLFVAAAVKKKRTATVANSVDFFMSSSMLSTMYKQNTKHTYVYKLINARNSMRMER